MNHTCTQRLQELLAHLDGAYAPNTLRAYKADMLEFITYCDKAAKCALPADPNTVSDFLMQTMDKDIESSIDYLACQTPPSTLR